MVTPHQPAPDVDVPTSSLPIPGFGLVPINAFGLDWPEPALGAASHVSVRVGRVAASDQRPDFVL
jgi:hypothetical protein